MKKLDKFIINSFIGPFLLTTGLATFILLIQYMLKYFDDFVGKNLGFAVFSELLFYFSLNMLQVALPLGVLVSSLMTFGNLGEQFELSAIKSAGISLIRTLRPIFFFIILLAYGAFNFNNYVVPAANLKAYSLLYDIKHKKAALNITAGVFYDEIPDYSIYVKEKYSDNKTLKNILIYDHTEGDGNKRVIIADSSLMYTIYNDKYLKLELYNGNYYIEEEEKKKPIDQLFRSQFKRMDMVFSLSSFDLQRTKEELFENNRQMKNLAELTRDIDSLKRTMQETKNSLIVNVTPSFKYSFTDRSKKMIEEIEILKKPEQTDNDLLKPEAPDSLMQKASIFPAFLLAKFNLVAQHRPNLIKDSILKEFKIKGMQNSKSLSLNDTIIVKKDSSEQKKIVNMDTITWKHLYNSKKSREGDILLFAKNNAQNVKVNLGSTYSRIYSLRRDVSKYVIEKQKKYSQAVACIIMFLIGAPLGAIIKKGGLGVPVIISIFFFLTYYVITIMCAKWANEGLMHPIVAAWLSIFILLPFGLFFLRQARIDARLFEIDFYNIWIDKMRTRIFKR
ncbi:MAG: lipopolysaccharide export system permease protein [Cyclobacteriaceae bacterium]|jgi:lipopolysaccharide export system permease protein